MLQIYTMENKYMEKFGLALEAQACAAPLLNRPVPCAEQHGIRAGNAHTLALPAHDEPHECRPSHLVNLPVTRHPDDTCYV